MFTFANIDDFIPYRFEKVGMLKGKRWYVNSNRDKMGLFKPKRYEFKDRKVFCANHYGEFIGSILGKHADMEVCETELAHLSRYFQNIHKERNHATPEEKDGCVSYSLLKRGDVLEPGKMVIEKYKSEHEQSFKELTKNNNRNNANDNIEVILAATEFRTREIYKTKEKVSEAYIQKKVNDIRKKVIEMVIYDCLYGNYDRHDENWSMYLMEDGNIDLYPLYDNEKVLGLYENQNFIENTLKTGNVEHIAEEKFFSRMIVPGETKSTSHYKIMLEYLINTYPEETREILKKQLEGNTCEKVKTYLEECQTLPSAYIQFGTQMYTYRNAFAKELQKCSKQWDNLQMLEKNIETVHGEER